jgi:indolepyruvate ferredoxin oxidoreductase
MYSVLKRVAAFKGLRGTPLDIFGYTSERRMERKLRDDYIAMLEDISVKLSANNIDLVVKLAEVPERIRGYGPVKLEHVNRAKAIEADLLGELKTANDLASKTPKPIAELA